MRRLLLTALSFLLAGPAWAQWPSTRATETLKRMFTQGGHFGFPPYAADPFTCTAETKRATYYNTTSNTALFCNGTTWEALGGASLPVVDTTAVVKGSVDATKLLRLEADGGTTGTTSVWSLLAGGGIKVEADTATPGVEVVNSAHEEFGFVVSTAGAGNNYDLLRGGGSAVDAFVIRLDASVQSHVIKSTNKLTVRTTTAADVVIDTDSRPRSYLRSAAKALTSATATSFVSIAVPNLSMVGGVLDYSIQAADATDAQSRSGSVPFAIAVTSAGAETCTIGTVAEVAALTSGTLTNTFTCDVTGTNTAVLKANADSSLTETTLQIVYQVRLNPSAHAVTVTPQ